MKALIDSLSFTSCAILIAFLSVGLVWPLCYLRSAVFRRLGVVILPFVFAYSLYWLPVWLGVNPSEYSAWAGLVVGTWFLSGSIPSAALVLILRKRWAKQSSGEG